MKDSFSCGNVVSLKSGGLKMTVESVEETSGEISCIWYDEKKGVFTRKKFKATVLKEALSEGEVRFATIIHPPLEKDTYKNYSTIGE